MGKAMSRPKYLYLSSSRSLYLKGSLGNSEDIGSLRRRWGHCDQSVYSHRQNTRIRSECSEVGGNVDVEAEFWIVGFWSLVKLDTKLTLSNRHKHWDDECNDISEKQQVAEAAGAD